MKVTYGGYLKLNLAFYSLGSFHIIYNSIKGDDKVTFLKKKR
jgi:hypothetical protein